MTSNTSAVPGVEPGAARASYVLQATREGRWWIVDVPAIDERTQARSLAEVEEMGRDLIAGALDVDPDSFDVDVQASRPDDVARALADAERREHEAQDTMRAAARDRRRAAQMLRKGYNMSAVDAAKVLGVTRGRVYQLLGEEKATSSSSEARGKVSA